MILDIISWNYTKLSAILHKCTVHNSVNLTHCLNHTSLIWRWILNLFREFSSVCNNSVDGCFMIPVTFLFMAHKMILIYLAPHPLLLPPTPPPFPSQSQPSAQREEETKQREQKIKTGSGFRRKSSIFYDQKSNFLFVIFVKKETQGVNSKENMTGEETYVASIFPPE